jgi:hypothetical protein
MICSSVILNLKLTHLSMVLLKQSVLQQIYLLICLNSITVSITSQGQTDFINFDLSQALDMSRILFSSLNSLDSLNVTLLSSKVTYHPDFLFFGFGGRPHHLFPCCQECHKALLGDQYF